MTIRLDRARYSVVVTCSDCPTYREVRGDPITAGRAGAEHDRREHDSAAGRRAVLAAIRRRQGLR
jgi:hypothetical protein